ncbi:GTPase Era [Peredibacter sp. HCB2-198]|uniref:GTPase Era n=1 Tax=Peredibacter sp. HCB2-198 TaxID=3383025 RepID=UPI0038B5504F
MLFENQHPHNKAIMIAVLGKPNVGKSSFINHLLGFDLTIVSSKPQTTRNQFHCAFTIDRTEVVMVDTPGVHSTSQELNRRMNGQAQMGSEGVDINFVLVDLTTNILGEFKDFLKNFEAPLSRTWIIFTKADLVKKEELNLGETLVKMQELCPSIEKHFIISSKDGHNIHELTGAIQDAAPNAMHLYPGGDASNMNERFFATEYIREQAFRLLKEELPYEIAVVIDEYKDVRKKDEDAAPEAHISASILVNRPSQRAIVVGRGGSIIKEIGMNARKKIEAMTGGKVHLNLHVKVSPKWMTNNYVLDEIGLPRTQKSARVWRKK